MRRFDPVLAVLVAVVAAKVALSARWGLLADEAYYWSWAERPALGYYDHPPAIAWILSLGSVFGKSEWAVRAPGIAMAAAAAWGLRRRAGDPLLWLLLWAGCPILFALTLFATPDALLLAAWCLGLGAATAPDGPHWGVVGFATGLALLAKPTGVLLLPLVLLGSHSRVLGQRRPWIAMAIAGGMALPWLWWLSQHHGVTLAFQWRHGLVSDEPPGLGGLGRWLRDQVLVVNPVLAIVAVAFGGLRAWQLVALAGTRPEDRADRILLVASFGILFLFGLASLRAPGEANWAAPAWPGLFVVLARAPGLWRRVAYAGAVLGCLAVPLVAWHVERPLIRLAHDPADRVLEGPALAAAVRTGLPGLGTEAGTLALPGLVTERYQEAALLHYYTGMVVRRDPRCGRDDQHDLWEAPGAATWLLRPTRSGDTVCDGEVDAAGPPVRIVGTVGERIVGRWDLVPLAPP